MGFATVFRFFPVFLLSTFLSTTAFAFDAAEYVGKIQNLANARGVAIRYGSMEPVGEAGFVLNDVTIQGPQGNPPAKVARIRIEGIEELAGDSFAAALVKFEGFSVISRSKDNKEIIVSVVGGTGKDVYFANPQQGDAPFFHFPKTSYEVRSLTVSVDGIDLITIASLLSNSTSDTDTKKQTFDASVNGIDVNLESSNNPRFNANRRAMGYDSLSMDVAISGSWDMNSGKIVIDNYSIDAKDAGRLSVSAGISGYTEELAVRLRKLTAQLQTTGNPKERQRINIALLGMFSQLYVDNLKISYIDASLVDRILEFRAAQMGMQKSELVTMLPTMLPMIAAPLQNPEFIGSLAGNVAKFLNQPGDISISFNPSRPIPLTQLVVTGSTQPHKLIEMLGVTVDANVGK